MMDANLAANAARETVLQTVKQHLDMLKQIDDLVAQYPESQLVKQFGASIGESIVRETSELFETLLDAALRSIASRVDPALSRSQLPPSSDTPTLTTRDLLSRMRTMTRPEQAASTGETK